MILVQLKFVHYGSEGSEDGIKELIVANNLEQVIEYIDLEWMYGDLQQYGKEEDEFCPSQQWIKENPEKMKTLGDYELTTNDLGDIKGTKYNLCMWFGGNIWIEDDYEVTLWDWSNQQEITDFQINILDKLNLIKDIRNV